MGFQILSLIQPGCKEGDVLNISLKRDPEAIGQAKGRVSELMEKLKQKGQGELGIIQDAQG